MSAAHSLISPVLECASSFNRFDYPFVYISLAPVCFHPAIRLPLSRGELMPVLRPDAKHAGVVCR